MLHINSVNISHWIMEILQIPFSMPDSGRKSSLVVIFSYFIIIFTVRLECFVLEIGLFCQNSYDLCLRL